MWLLINAGIKVNMLVKGTRTPVYCNFYFNQLVLWDEEVILQVYFLNSFYDFVSWALPVKLFSEPNWWYINIGYHCSWPSESKTLNSLWPRDAIWCNRSGSTLPQVTACCLTVPSHYLNQCWLISKVHCVTFILGKFHIRYLSLQSLKLAFKFLV